MKIARSNVLITWLDKPANQDYASAMSFLCLLYNKKTTIKVVDKLKMRSDDAFKR